VGVHPAHRTVGPLGDVGPPRLLQGLDVRADDHRRGAVLRQADELPVPHPDLQGTAPLLSRAPAPLRGVRDCVPL
jgi:hypothetical protein